MNTKLQVESFKLQVLSITIVVVVSMMGVVGYALCVVGQASGVMRPDVVITQAKPNPNPYQKLYEEMLYPCVRISTESGVGSGVVISATDYTDYILTAAHVVGHNQVVRIEFYDQTTINASVVLSDTAKDLALISVPITCSYVARLAPKDYTPYLFTPVWAVGCSLGLPPRPSQGIITAIPLRDLGVSAVSYWEISAPILPGNSGGPVFDAKTPQVIGIAVWVKVYQGQLVTTMAGIVPIQTVYKFLESVEFIESKESRTPNSTNSMNSLNSKERR